MNKNLKILPSNMSNVGSLTLDYRLQLLLLCLEYECMTEMLILYTMCYFFNSNMWCLIVGSFTPCEPMYGIWIVGGHSYLWTSWMRRFSYVVISFQTRKDSNVRVTQFLFFVSFVHCKYFCSYPSQITLVAECRNWKWHGKITPRFEWWTLCSF